MLTVPEALALVRSHVQPAAPVDVPLAEASGRTLAEDVACDLDSPPHDKSMVDGYAVRASDLTSETTELKVLEEVLAGRVPTRVVEPGTATRIMTGAPAPSGADAVVMIEQSELLPTTGDADAAPRVVLRTTGVRSGQNIMRRGTSLVAGTVVLRAGDRIRAAEVGCLAEFGRAVVRTFPRPSVAILSTGDELVEPHETPGPGQIRNSNGPMLAALVREAGAEPRLLPTARDELAALEASVAAGLTADVLVLSGGVSAGVADLVPQVLARLGVRQVFHKVHLRPGKPLWFGVAPRPDENAPARLVFGLPGNPVSSLVCFQLFVRPALSVLAGGPFAGLRVERRALATDFQHRGDRPTYYPARYEETPGDGADATRHPPTVRLLNWQGSADLATLAAADALAHFPAGTRSYAAGESIETLRLPG